MRIIALTDVHGSYDKMLTILSSETGYDAIVIGGDLTTHGTPREAEDAVKKLMSFGKPVFVVAGNMDPPAIEETFDRLGVSINARGVILNGVGFFGVSASPETPFHTPYEISEEEIERRADEGWKHARAATRKVFVPHAPPVDTKLDKVLAGRHVGSTAVRAFVEKHQPDVLICGHIHEARATDILGKTKMVNCGPAGKGCYAIIELGESVTVETRG